MSKSFYSALSRLRRSPCTSSGAGRQGKAAGDSRTLPQRRDWSVCLRATVSGRFWSAAVFCRFPFLIERPVTLRTGSVGKT